MTLDPELLEILACPECKSPLELKGERLICKNPEDRRAYRVEDDIPVMLVEESEQLSPEDWKAALGAG